MGHNTTETDTYTANIVVPDDGDDAVAATVETPAQSLANRTKFLLEHLKFLSSLDNTTGSRSALNGAKHIRRVTSIANLQAIAGGAGLDGECAVVDAIGLYIYSSSDATAADGNWIVAPSSGGGRWRHVLYTLLNAAQGIPRLDGATKIPVGQLTNRLVSVDVNEQSIGSSPSSPHGISSTSFVDLGATYELNVTTVAGDVLVIDAVVIVDTNGNVNETGEVKLFCDGNAKLLLPFAYNDNKHTVLHFLQKFVATDASTNLKFQWRCVSGDGVRFFTPFSLRCQVFRP